MIALFLYGVVQSPRDPPPGRPIVIRESNCSAVPPGLDFVLCSYGIPALTCRAILIPSLWDGLDGHE